ncbi:hypothetical protein [Actinoplanes sp. TFC3]|uniref:hypothetical protein n=1 Tax=Actinoplanes sp. TFC3 TaxID=1710355 RepID=UPI00082D4CE3|nr:hypothetical protein [Actinoplanes sp. TFC3]
MPETDSVATCTVAVDRGVWDDAALAAMVAPPVTVSSLPLSSAPGDSQRRVKEARLRQNMPSSRHRRTI